jgi:hypothetical protein
LFVLKMKEEATSQEIQADFPPETQKENKAALC